MLTKEEFTAKDGLKRQAFEIDGLGTVNMRELSVAERVALSEAAADDEDLAVRMVATSLCGPDGESMFPRDELDDAIEVIQRKALRTIKALQKAFLEVCGMDQAAIEEAVGNSIEIPSEPSSSDSLGISDTPQPEPSPANSPTTT